MFEDVCRQHDVVLAVELRRQAPVEVGLDEAVDPLLHAVVGDEVDSGDVMPKRAELLSEVAVGAAEVEDLARLAAREPAHDTVVRRSVGHLAS